MTARIDGYAESMFGLERLHPKWIDACAAYLRHVFGEQLEGKVFLDYAFGRGNWSLAALKAGARRVVAIDASEGNVRRFTDHCRAQGVRDIEILHGNVMTGPIDRTADILWIYGILPCIEDCDAFLAKLAAMRSGDGALAVLYAYDKGSLRQTVIDGARTGVVYDTAEAFARDSFLFTPPARMRARDDLTAERVNWSTAQELADLGRRHGFVVEKQFEDFTAWLTGPSAEFQPHHLLCGFGAGGGQPVAEPAREQAGDFAVLAAMISTVMAHAGAARRSVAIGLINTHFSALRYAGKVETVVVEDFLFLMHAALRLSIPASAFLAEASVFYEAAVKAMADQPRRSPGPSPLGVFLETNTLRF